MLVLDSDHIQCWSQPISRLPRDGMFCISKPMPRTRTEVSVSHTLLLGLVLTSRDVVRWHDFAYLRTRLKREALFTQLPLNLP
jgi:hypothetical protein